MCTCAYTSVTYPQSLPVYPVYQQNKALFLTHKGVQTVLPFMKPGKVGIHCGVHWSIVVDTVSLTRQMFCWRAVDIYLVMSVDSGSSVTCMLHIM